MKKIFISLAIASSFAFATSVHAGCIKSGGGCVVSESGKPVNSNIPKAGSTGHSNASMPAKNRHSAASMPDSSSKSASSMKKDTAKSAPAPAPAQKSEAKPAGGVKDPCCWAP